MSVFILIKNFLYKSLIKNKIEFVEDMVDFEEKEDEIHVFGPD